jgi:hypothetical protein
VASDQVCCAEYDEQDDGEDADDDGAFDAHLACSLVVWVF